MPFKEEIKESIYEKIEEALVDMDPDTVLFLRNINQLDYLTKTKSGYYVRKKEEKLINGLKYYHCQIIGGQGVKSSYLFFQENVGANSSLQVSMLEGIDEETGNELWSEYSGHIKFKGPSAKMEDITGNGNK